MKNLDSKDLGLDDEYAVAFSDTEEWLESRFVKCLVRENDKNTNSLTAMLTPQKQLVKCPCFACEPPENPTVLKSQENIFSSLNFYRRVETSFKKFCGVKIRAIKTINPRLVRKESN